MLAQPGTQKNKVRPSSHQAWACPARQATQLRGTQDFPQQNTSLRGTSIHLFVAVTNQSPGTYVAQEDGCSNMLRPGSLRPTVAVVKEAMPAMS